MNRLYRRVTVPAELTVEVLQRMRMLIAVEHCKYICWAYHDVVHVESYKAVVYDTKWSAGNGFPITMLISSLGIADSGSGFLSSRLQSIHSPVLYDELRKLGSEKERRLYLLDDIIRTLKEQENEEREQTDTH